MHILLASRPVEGIAARLIGERAAFWNLQEQRKIISQAPGAGYLQLELDWESGLHGPMEPFPQRLSRICLQWFTGFGLKSTNSVRSGRLKTDLVLETLRVPLAFETWDPPGKGQSRPS
jgi:hypothetical protein